MSAEGTTNSPPEAWAKGKGLQRTVGPAPAPGGRRSAELPYRCSKANSEKHGLSQGMAAEALDSGLMSSVVFLRAAYRKMQSTDSRLNWLKEVLVPSHL